MSLDTKTKKAILNKEQKTEARFAEVKIEFAELKADIKIIKWMVILVFVAIIGQIMRSFF